MDSGHRLYAAPCGRGAEQPSVRRWWAEGRSCLSFEKWLTAGFDHPSIVSLARILRSGMGRGVCLLRAGRGQAESRLTVSGTVVRVVCSGSSGSRPTGRGQADPAPHALVAHVAHADLLVASSRPQAGDARVGRDGEHLIVLSAGGSVCSGRSSAGLVPWPTSGRFLGPSPAFVHMRLGSPSIVVGINPLPGGAGASGLLGTLHEAGHLLRSVAHRVPEAPPRWAPSPGCASELLCSRTSPPLPF